MEIERQNNPRQEDDKNGKSGVLEVRELNLHCAEFSPPADAWVGRTVRRWWGLPAHAVPIGGLDVLEVFGCFLVVHLEW